MSDEQGLIAAGVAFILFVIATIYDMSGNDVGHWKG